MNHGEQNMEWRNEKRHLKDLVPWKGNPRRINKEEAKRLLQSYDEFGQVETIAIGPENEVYNGHQRLSVLLAKYGQKHEVEVRVSSRPLTEMERKKLTVFLHRGTVGEWDWDILANEFEKENLITWGFHEEELGVSFVPPQLEDLKQQFGEPNEKDFWPVIKITVSPETMKVYETLMTKMIGETEGDKFDMLLGLAVRE
jgi:hypothetical protein